MINYSVCIRHSIISQCARISLLNIHFDDKLFIPINKFIGPSSELRAFVSVTLSVETYVEKEV